MDETRKQSITTDVHYRSLILDRAGLSADSRSVPASLSSEAEVPRWWCREVLVHAPDAVDLSRTNGGLPLLWNHDSNTPIGRVDNVRLDNSRLRGLLTFSRNPKAEEVWKDVQDGMLKDVSIGYRIISWEESNDSDLIRVTRWELLETSIAPVPADYTVGIGRSSSGPASSHHPSLNPVSTRMETPEVTPEVRPPTENAPAAVPNIVEMRRDFDVIRKDAEQRAIKAERTRVDAVGAAFDRPSLPRTAEFRALRARALQDGWTESQANAAILDALGALSEGVVDHSRTTDDMLGIHHEAQQTRSNPTAPPPSVQMGKDALEKYRAGAEQALIVRAGIDSQRESIRKARESGFLGQSLFRMADGYLRTINIDTGGMTDDAIIARALMTAPNGQRAIGQHAAYLTRASGMTTSDFANLLANTANKALMMGWDSAPETWQLWTRIGQVPDFKSATRVGMSGFTSLEKVPEDGEIKYGKFTDRKETIQAVSYAKKFRLTYQAIKNDDLSAFTAVPRGMGRAAQRVIGDVVYALLDGTGPTLTQDSVALWDTSTHKNYVAAATAPTVSTLDTAFTAMATQTDPNNGGALNIVPRYLLVPKALETTARVLNTSQYDPAASPGSTSGKNIMAPNPFQNRLEVISDARLDGQTNGTTAWYLLSDQNIFDTVEVAFVDGVAEPYLREEQEWDTRGVEWVVGVDFGVSALDFRAMHKYKGST